MKAFSTLLEETIKSAEEVQGAAEALNLALASGNPSLVFEATTVLEEKLNQSKPMVIRLATLFHLAGKMTLESAYRVLLTRNRPDDAQRVQQLSGAYHRIQASVDASRLSIENSMVALGAPALIPPPSYGEESRPLTRGLLAKA